MRNSRDKEIAGGINRCALGDEKKLSEPPREKLGKVVVLTP